MKRILFFLFVVVNFAWSIPKPMESITNYNVMMLHGALGSDKGIKEKNSLAEASKDSSLIIWNYLGCVMERILLELLRVRSPMLS